MESDDRNDKAAALQELIQKLELALVDNKLDKPEWTMLCFAGDKTKLRDRLNLVKSEARQDHHQEVALHRMILELLLKAYSLKGNHGSELVKYIPLENQPDFSDPKVTLESRVEQGLELLPGEMEWAYFIHNSDVPNQEEEIKIIDAAAEIISRDLSVLAYGGKNTNVGLHQTRAIKSFDSCVEIISRKA